MQVRCGLKQVIPMLCLAVGAVGCAQNQEPQGQAAEAGVRSEPVELVFYSTSADTPESFDQRYGDYIRKKFPTYTIRYIQSTKGNSFPELMTRGEQIDIYWDSISMFASNVVEYGVNYDMTELMNARKLDAGRFEAVPIDAAKAFSNGGLHGIPVTNGTMVTYYNKDLFDKFGVSYPKDGMTWDEVNELAKKLNRQEDGVPYTGLAISPKHLLRMNNFSEPFVDAAGKKQLLDTANWRKVLDAYFASPGTDALMRERTAALKMAPYYNEFFKNKTAAMFPFLANQPETIPELFREMNWGVVSFPTFQELPGVGAQAYPVYFGITAQSKAKEAAMDVIQYLTSDEYQMDISKRGIMTALNSKAIKDAYGTATEFKDHNLKAAYFHAFAPIQRKSKHDETIITVLNGAVPKLIGGQEDMNTFIRNVGENVQKRIDAAVSQ